MVIEGLEKLVNLEELYLSYNGIEEMQGLDTLVRWHARDHSGGNICNTQWSLYDANVGNFWKGFLCVVWLFSFVVLQPNPCENISERYHWLISCVKLVYMFGLHLEFEQCSCTCVTSLPTQLQHNNHLEWQSVTNLWQVFSGNWFLQQCHYKYFVPFPNGRPWNPSLQIWMHHGW